MAERESDAGETAPPGTSAFQVEVGQAAGHGIIEGVPDHVAGDTHARDTARAVEVPHAAPAPVADQSMDVSTTTDPHRDYASATGMNDSSHSDSPISSEHDAPVEAASDPTPETPPEPEPEKHEDPPAPEPTHEPAAPETTHVETTGTEGHTE